VRKMFSIRLSPDVSRVENLVRSNAKRQRVSVLARGKRTERLGMRGDREPARGCDARRHAVPAQQCEHVKQAGACRFASDRYTYGMYEDTRLHTARVGHRAERRLG